MRKFLILATFISFGLFGSAQETGMHFEHGISWQAIKEKAKKENKYIFMDAFTTWCGPCKMMAAKIFPLQEVGAFYNDQYINVKVQLDTTKNDNEEVKAWYKDAHDIMVNYNVKVFPTYLFFSPDGALVHRAVGSSDAATFINKGKDALNPEKQYYTLVRRYEKGERSPDFLRNLTTAAGNAYEREAMSRYGNEYLATQENIYTPDNIKLLRTMTMTTKDKGFQLMLENPDKFDAVMGEGKSHEMVRALIMQEDIFPVIWGKNRDNFKWEDLSKKVATKYPTVGKEITAYAQVFYYQQQGNWEMFTPAVTEYMNTYGKNLSASDLNSFAWAIFQHCDDMACVAKALEWSKKSIEKDKNAAYMDTYANILFKLGKKEDAIKAQESTIAFATTNKDSNLEDYISTLEKIKKGEKTWD